MAPMVLVLVYRLRNPAPDIPDTASLRSPFMDGANDVGTIHLLYNSVGTQCSIGVVP